MSADTDKIIARETYWKNAFATKTQGYNSPRKHTAQGYQNTRFYHPGQHWFEPGCS